MAEVDLTARVVVPEQVLARQLDDELVILDLDSESYFGLDDVGTAMWNALVAAESIEQAYERLLEEYDVEPPELRVDLQAFIRQLLDKRLVELRRD